MPFSWQVLDMMLTNEHFSKLIIIGRTLNPIQNLLAHPVSVEVSICMEIQSCRKWDFLKQYIYAKRRSSIFQIRYPITDSDT